MITGPQRSHKKEADDEGARAVAYDPIIKTWPGGVGQGIELRASVEEALKGSAAAVIATEWPEFRSIDVWSAMKWLPAPPTILHPGAFLETTLGTGASFRYLTVGSPG